MSRVPTFPAAVLLIAVWAPGAVARDELKYFYDFSDNVKLTREGGFLVVECDGLPNHPHGPFPNADNPNTIRRQAYRFRIPIEPRLADEITPLPMGPIGVALNGVPFYNPYNAAGRDAVAGPFAEVFDSCCGHPDPRGRYHYHKYPVCVNSPFKDEPGKMSPLIGYAFDGVRIYGPNCKGGTPATGLDECNGHECDGPGYHYHVTAGPPYILGGYRCVVERSNFDRPGWANAWAVGVAGAAGAAAIGLLRRRLSRGR